MCPSRFLYLTAEEQSAFQLCWPPRQSCLRHRTIHQFISETPWVNIPVLLRFYTQSDCFCHFYCGLLFLFLWVVYGAPFLKMSYFFAKAWLLWTPSSWGWKGKEPVGEQAEFYSWVCFGLVWFDFAQTLEPILLQVWFFLFQCHKGGSHNVQFIPTWCGLLSPPRSPALLQGLSKEGFISVTLLPILTIY